MKKILLLVLFMFLITGCKVEYNLVINNDLTVSESVTMTGTDEFFDSFYKSSRMNVLNMVFDEYSRNELKNNNYEYRIVEGNTPYVVADKKYNNLDDFTKNTIFKEQYFEELNVSENNGIVSLQSDGFIPINYDSLERYGIKTTKLSITLPYEVIENNAASHDLKTNTYTWYINEDAESFSLLLSYDTNKNYEMPDDTNWLMVLIGLIIVIGLIIGNFILNKKNK